jgi:hypothetical protein
MAELSHSENLQIYRARDGIAELDKCIADLDHLQKTLALTLLNGKLRGFEPAAKRILVTVNTYFELKTAEGQEFAKAANFAAVPEGTDETTLKRELESNLAASKDTLESAKRALQARVAKIRGESVKKSDPLSVKSPGQPQASADGKKPLFSFRPSLWGMSVDLGELWRRIRG